jgi:signal transduction histidine kinase
VKVKDKGKRMTPQRLAEVKSHRAGVGIRGMRERVRQFSGEMKIESAGEGTTVSVSFPVSETASTESPRELAPSSSSPAGA